MHRIALSVVGLCQYFRLAGGPKKSSIDYSLFVLFPSYDILRQFLLFHCLGVAPGTGILVDLAVAFQMVLIGYLAKKDLHTRGNRRLVGVEDTVRYLLRYRLPGGGAGDALGCPNDLLPVLGHL